MHYTRDIDDETPKPRKLVLDVADILQYFIFLVKNHSTMILWNSREFYFQCKENSVKLHGMILICSFSKTTMRARILKHHKKDIRLGSFIVDTLCQHLIFLKFQKVFFINNLNESDKKNWRLANNLGGFPNFTYLHLKKISVFSHTKQNFTVFMRKNFMKYSISAYSLRTTRIVNNCMKRVKNRINNAWWIHRNQNFENQWKMLTLMVVTVELIAAPSLTTTSYTNCWKTGLRVLGPGTTVTSTIVWLDFPPLSVAW